LGGLSIESGTSMGNATVNRRPLALLALLAVKGRRGLSRDSIVALFWPDSDAEHGRNSLSQMLSMVRRELDTDDVVLGTTELRVNSGVLACDVTELEERIAADELEAATRLYTGPFLDGVFLKNAPEFERWTTSDRDWHVQATPSSGWPRERPRVAITYPPFASGASALVSHLTTAGRPRADGGAGRTG
jgi:DNA-binding SARP family transcriptional activator